MSRERCEQNLQRLLQELQGYLSANGIVAPASSAQVAAKIAPSIFLAHSTADANFVAICSPSGRVLSSAGLDAAGIKPLKPDAVEITLGTAAFVFLYAAAFSFPSSGCGLLFAPTLEQQHSDNGFATAFDSGGLISVFQRPDMSEPPRDFFMRHEFPISEHRSYLQSCLAALFSTPLDYFHGNPPQHPGPIGLTGGDCRRWSHEVRIPNEVVVRSPHLQAVFIPRRLGLVPEIKHLVRWCESEGFDAIVYDADRENDFAKLKRACVEYLRDQLL
jgi:hypothetical protein